MPATRPTTLPFTKMHGIGNDYVYVDAFEHEVDDPAALSRVISNRNTGVGSDGLILIMPPSAGVDADVRMRMFNADGSESEMCGNGVRCVCKYAHDHGLSRANPMRVETGGGVLSLTYTLDDERLVDRVTVDMGRPRLAASEIPVDLGPLTGPVVNHPIETVVDRHARAAGDRAWLERSGLDPRMTCVSMGNPHVILYCDRVAEIPLESIGPRLERDPIFPNRINVHFVEVRSPREVVMRTWERGSGATLACGTGASAVCVAGVLTGRSRRDLLAHLPGGDLDLRWDDESDHVLMTGPAVETFSGSWRRQESASQKTATRTPGVTHRE